MADRRWPHMRRVDGGPLPGLDTLDTKRVTRWALDIERRTGRFAFYNAARQKVHFCMRQDDCSVAPVAKQVHSPRFGLILAPVDDVCREINACRVGARVQDRIIESRRKAGEHDAREMMHKITEDARPEMRDRAKHLTGVRTIASVP